MSMDRSPAPYIAAATGSAAGGVTLAVFGWLTSGWLGFRPSDVDVESVESLSELLTVLADFLGVVVFVGGGAAVGAALGAGLGVWLAGGSKPVLTGLFTAVGIGTLGGTGISLSEAPPLRWLVILGLFVAAVCGVLAHWIAAELLADGSDNPSPPAGSSS